MLVFAVAFISWFYRAFSNIKKIDNQVEDSEWWTVFGWIVPVFNLFKPYKLLVKMNDVTYILPPPPFL